MNKKEILLELVNTLFEFDAQRAEEYTMDDFVGYLNTKIQRPSQEMRKIEGDQEQWIKEDYRKPSGDIAILLVLMYRYAKSYVKKALKDSSIQTADEFSFLITLMTHESLTKTELINKQIMEKTSGTEVIKRLLNNGMISEFSDEQDRRSVRVKITPKGYASIAEILPNMSLVSEIVVGNLSEQEIVTLAYLLKKLDHYHNDIFLNKKNTSLEELRQA